MPELPEVETMRRGVESIRGAKITSVERTRCTRKPIQIKPTLRKLRDQVAGSRIDSVDRLGKRVILRTDRDVGIVLEPRMTGLVLLADPPTTEHLRVRIGLADCEHDELLYWDRRGLGLVYSVALDDLNSELGLGPDALDVTVDVLQERLGRSNQAIKVALLDQAKLAGIGNLYAAEILHMAKIHPETKCTAIKRSQWRTVSDCMAEVLDAAIEHEGSTLSDGTYRNALNQAGGYQNYHRVYDRAGEKCAQCKVGLIKRIVQCQRATFFCPRCQRLPRRRR